MYQALFGYDNRREHILSGNFGDPVRRTGGAQTGVSALVVVKVIHQTQPRDSGGMSSTDESQSSEKHHLAKDNKAPFTAMS